MKALTLPFNSKIFVEQLRQKYSDQCILNNFQSIPLVIEINSKSYICGILENVVFSDDRLFGRCYITDELFDYIYHLKSPRITQYFITSVPDQKPTESWSDILLFKINDVPDET